jgi:hypothetical protein
MNENVFLVFVSSLNEINHLVKQTFDILILGILQKECQVFNVSVLKPVFTVVSGTVDYVLYLMPLKGFVVPCHLFP